MRTIANTKDDTRLTGLQYLTALAAIARWWDGNVAWSQLEHVPVVKL